MLHRSFRPSVIRVALVLLGVVGDGAVACSPSSPPNDGAAADQSAIDARMADDTIVVPTDAVGSDAAVDASGADAIEAAPDVQPDVQVDAPFDPLVIGTAAGPVHGTVVTRNVRAFLGMPYAAAPVGALRWAPPAARAPWGTPIDASHVGPACPQGPDPVSGQPVVYSEDCLTLNVWTPVAPGAPPRAVMFFIHGGSFTGGSGGLPLYDGAYMAQRANVVVVTINYRLGALGWLAHPAFEDPTYPTGFGHGSAGNYGLMDQQFAMRWVRDNIASFGGDPANVTIFGESAGSISVCLHLATTQAQGLFVRAIGESGSCTYVNTTLYGASPIQEPAEGLGARFATALGCVTGDLATQAACMRATPVANVLAAIGPSSPAPPGAAGWTPILDGYFFNETPWARFVTGRILRVPYLSGVNQDEATAFTLALQLNTMADYSAAVGAVMPHHVSEVMALYPVATYGTVRAAFNAFAGDLTFLCPATAQATAVSAVTPNTYVYYFTHPVGVGIATGLGVFHSSELPFVFGNFVAPYAPSDDPGRALSDPMIDFWTRFGVTGDPNPSGGTQWPAFSAASARYVILGTTIGSGVDLHKPVCDSLATWLAMGP